MRLVFVNYSSPRVRHVSGIRVWKFAETIAKRGHRVVVLTSSHGMEGDPGLPPASLCRELEGHDWSRPFHLLVPDPENRWLKGVAEGTVPKWIRAIIIAHAFTEHRGMFYPWVEAARKYLGEIVAHFAPDLVWATFGNTDSLHIGQSLAHAAGVPWVMDIKDGWDPFVPAPFRNLTARRFRDAARITSNSDFSAAVAHPWFPQPRTTVYSGVDPAFLNGVSRRLEDNEFRIVLSGGLYQEPVLKDFLDGLRSWLERLSASARSHVTLAYAGAATDVLKRNLSAVNSLCEVELHAYLPFPEFMGLIQSASVNTYLWLPATFHHKLIELLACDRPIIAFPGEHEESKAIAREVSGDLRCCETPERLAAYLDCLWKHRSSLKPKVNLEVLSQFTWDAQAKNLFGVFDRALTK